MIAMRTFSFHPRPAATLVAIVAVPCFVALGFWQLDRAHSRQAAQRLLEARAAAPTMAMPAIIVRAESLRDRHVIAAGRYEPAHQFFLDNRVWRGQAGYDVVTPLQLEGSALRVLVDRGWIPAPADRRQLPAVATPAVAVEVDGQAVVPPSWTFSLGQSGNEGWQPVWQRLDLERFEALTGEQLQPAVIRLSPASAAGGFVREWPRADAGAARNLSYAVQWFVFAAATVAFWVGSALGRRRP